MDNFHYLELVRSAAMKVMLPEETVRLVLEALLETMKDALIERKRVILRKFGTIRVMLRSNQRMGNFATVVFRASDDLQVSLHKELVNARRQEERGHG